MSGTIGLVAVGDEFFVALRVLGERVIVFLSDITAAWDWPLAEQVLEYLDMPVPDEEELEAILQDEETVLPGRGPVDLRRPRHWTRWSWARSPATAICCPTRCCPASPRGWASPSRSSARSTPPSARLTPGSPPCPATAEPFAAAFVRTATAGRGAEVDLSAAEFADDVSDLVQEALGLAGDELALLCVEVEDEWFASSASRATDEPRVFISDAQPSGDRSGELFGELAGVAPDEEANGSAYAPRATSSCSATSGVSAEELLELSMEEGVLPGRHPRRHRRTPRLRRRARPAAVKSAVSSVDDAPFAAEPRDDRAAGHVPPPPPATRQAMRLALAEAVRAAAAARSRSARSCSTPDGGMLAAAGNDREATGDPTGARRGARPARRGRRAAATWRLDGCTLVVTLEPCTMCAGAAVQSRVDRVVYGAVDEQGGAAGSLWDVVRDRRLNHRPEVVMGVLAEECAALLTEFFAARR